MTWVGKAGIINTVGMLAVFLLQFCAVYQAPRWGSNSPFPFTILRSIEMPVLIGVSAGVAAFLAGSATERKLLYSITVASLLQIGTIRAMVSASQPVQKPSAVTASDMGQQQKHH